MADLMIKHGRIVAMDGALMEGVVAIEDGLISHVGKGTGETADRIIDATGCAVMPGLINAHTHLAMTLFRGFADDLPYQDWTEKLRQAERNLTPADVRTGAYLGILEMIKTGTTAFADMYIFMDEVAHVVEEAGMRAVLGYGMIEGLNEGPAEKLENRSAFVRKWNGTANGRIMAVYAPHSAASCSKEFLGKVKERAVRDNVGIHIHLLETEDELNSMKKRYGMCTVHLLDSIDFLGPDVLAAHCIWLSGKDIDILKNKRVNVVHCPASNMNLGVGVAPVPGMMEKGINVALGTDGAASSGSLDMWKEMGAASRLHKLSNPQAMPASMLLAMATSHGARALNIRAGVLRPGYHADIILVDMKKTHFVSHDLLSALVQGACGCDVKTSIVNGKILMEDREVLTLDEDKVMEDARKAMERLSH